MIKKVSLLFAFAWGIISFAQVTNSSPYSYFGIGDNNQQETTPHSSMGGIGQAIRSVNELNFSNPAALSALKFTTFSVSGKYKYLEVEDGSTIQSSSVTGISYLALGFPIGKEGGMMIGLQPNSSVGYSINQEILDDEGILVEGNSYKGKGGTTRLFGSFGYQVIAGLSLGIEGEYIFGKLENSVANSRVGLPLGTKHEMFSDLNGVSVKLATQYTKKLTNELNISAGFSAKLKHEIQAKSDEYMYSYSILSGVSVDTVYNKQEVGGKITRPLQWTAGIGVGKSEKWYAGINYSAQDALSFDTSILQNSNKVQYSTASKINVGGFWIPEKYSITKYWERVTYRAGLRYETPGLSINTQGNTQNYTAINDFGISFGLGLPIGNQLSQVNLGLEYGNRGNTKNGLIKENYFILHLNFNLADKWFNKRKIN